MSAVAKAAGTGAATAAGAGLWISGEGWPAAVMAGTAILATVALAIWVLTSDARTNRVLSLVAAFRFQRR